MAELSRDQCDRIIRKMFNVCSSEGVTLEQGMRIFFISYICIAIELGWSQKEFDESLEQISDVYRIELANHVLNEHQD